MSSELQNLGNCIIEMVNIMHLMIWVFYLCGKKYVIENTLCGYCKFMSHISKTTMC